MWATTCSKVSTCLDTICNEIIHIIIITLHVLLHSECRFPFFNHSPSHLIKKFQRFCNWSIPPRTVHLLFPVLFYFFRSLEMIFITISNLQLNQYQWIRGKHAKTKKFHFHMHHSNSHKKLEITPPQLGYIISCSYHYQPMPDKGRDWAQEIALTEPMANCNFLYTNLICIMNWKVDNSPIW